MEHTSLMPFLTSRFQVTFEIDENNLLSNNIIKLTPTYEKGSVALEIHLRDCVSKLLPQLLIDLSSKKHSTISLKQFDGDANVLRTTIYNHCEIDSITHYGLNYSDSGHFPSWIIKAHTRNITIE